MRNSPIPWPGGKAKLAKHVHPHIPEHILWCEPFAGGLGMFFNKPPSHAEVVNDTHQHLVNLFRVAKHHPQALQEEVRLIPYSRAEFEKLKAIDTEYLTDIQRAAWFFLSLDMSFGGQGIAGGFGYGTTGPTKSRWTILADIDRLHDRLARVTIECLDYADCIKRYDRPDTCFFVDPPYIGGAQKNYDSWSSEQMEALAAILRQIQGKFLLTVNDSAECREIFKGHQFHEITRQSPCNPPVFFSYR
jgi:DNA adenine methylase